MKQKLKKTLALLESAQGDVFGGYALGLYFSDESIFFYGGSGPSSLFDLASLTKVLCTTTLYAIAADKNLISLDQSVQEYFGNFPDQRVKLSHLLNHCSGLPAWLPLHTAFHDTDGIGIFDPLKTPKLARLNYENKILKSWTVDAFEKASVYSDLDFMLLGWILEKITNNRLDVLFQDWVTKNLNLKYLHFLPTSSDVIPTENCPWRKRILRGEVHDDNCFVLGGIAGHAGLFGNAEDVLTLGKLWLDNVTSKKVLLFSHKTAHHFFTFQHAPGTWTLGWDGISAERSSAGEYLSLASRGHLGFTGTSIWIDPQNQVVVSLLTNRVYPTRANEKIKEFRPLLHNTLFKELGLKSRQ